MRRALLLSVLLFSAPAIAHAQEAKSALDLPVGQTLLNLSATEQVEIDQDLLIGSLRYEIEGKDPKKLQDDINEIMKKALDASKAYTDIKTSTQQYYISKQERDVSTKTEPNKRESYWHGEQGLEIKSKDAAQLLKLSGELQALGLSMSNLNYTVSPELLESTQDSLLEGAIVKLKTKAERTAKALGKSSADLIEVNVDNGGYSPPQPMMARAYAMDGAAMKMDAPVAQAGQSQINMTISARALLKP